MTVVSTMVGYCVCVCRDPLAQFEVEKREHEIKMHKMEREMEEVFEMKVQEKLQKLKDIEADVSVLLHLGGGGLSPEEVRYTSLIAAKNSSHMISAYQMPSAIAIVVVAILSATIPPTIPVIT